MKQFLRSTAGKVTLFVLIMLISIFIAISILSTLFMLAMDFYRTGFSVTQTGDTYVDSLTRNYHMIMDGMRLLYRGRYLIPILGGVFLLINIALYVVLMCVTARRPEDEEVHVGPLARVPADLFLLLLFAAGFGLFGFAVVILEETYFLWGVFALTVAALIFTGLLLGTSMNMAGRIKEGSLFRNTVIGWILRLLIRVVKAIFRWIRKMFLGLWNILRNLRLIPFTILVTAVIILAEFLVIAFFFSHYPETDMLLFFWILQKLIVLPLVVMAAISMRKLEKQGQALAEGNLAYQADRRLLFGPFRRHSENLGQIGDGMQRAVENELRSERMKTELITNVSHDIKTPLTSIINYADLLEHEAAGNEKVQEYTEVISRQSARLKRLLEDLVEASKASTGNLEVHPEPCDAGIFLSQAAGEYEEKLKAASLKLVISQPEQPIYIMADGRRMWRVVDNLMNNVCKYAQPGTRVYLSLEQKQQRAVFTFRNISSAELNISEEELMERFVRGDRSRNTEGNGLGLSIARSLAELQGGTLYVQIDGDLFKVIVTFPVIENIVNE